MVKRARTPGSEGKVPQEGTRFPSQILGDNIHDIRQLRRLKQEDLSERMVNLGLLGWSRVTVSDVERAKRQTTVEELFRLASALGTTVAVLLDPHSGGRAGWIGIDLNVDMPGPVPAGLARYSVVDVDDPLDVEDPWALANKGALLWDGNTPADWNVVYESSESGLPRWIDKPEIEDGDQ